MGVDRFQPRVKHPGFGAEDIDIRNFGSSSDHLQKSAPFTKLSLRWEECYLLDSFVVVVLIPVD